MKRTLLIILPLLLAIVLPVQADNNPSNNNSAKQFKTGNRNTSTGPDAAFYNPAGTVFGKDGFTLEFSVLPFTSSQKIYDSGLDREFSSTAYSYFYPALNYTYKKDKWAVSGNIGVTNGGGSGAYKDGLPGYIGMGMGLIQLGYAGGLLPSGDFNEYSIENSFNGSALGLGGSIAFSYRINDWLSASAGMQYASQKNQTEGDLIITYLPASMEVGRTEINYDETGSNLGFILGLNLRPNDELLIANTFRYYSEMELTTKVIDGNDGDGLVTDGSKRKGTYVPYYFPWAFHMP